MWIRQSLQSSPSLANGLVDVLAECYADAWELAADASGLPLAPCPQDCPYAVAEIGDRGFWLGLPWQWLGGGLG